MGAVAGFLYWKFIGCTTGSYYIQSNPVRMPMYGALMGGLILNILKPGKHQQKQHKG